MPPVDEHRPHIGAPEIAEPETRRLLGALPVAAYTCDHEGRITSFNHRAVELWGRVPRLNDAVDRFCGSFKLFNADGSAIAHERSWMALALQGNRDSTGASIVIEQPGGARRMALVYAHPLRDAIGTVTGAINLLVDITQRQRGEERRPTSDRRIARIADRRRGGAEAVRAD
jgi:two-component system, LuxR family, sensor kinase FixL